MVAPATPPALYAEPASKIKLRPVSEIGIEKRGGSGSTEKCGGSGSASLPSLPDIQWEKRSDRPGFSCWHAPDGAQAHRNTKTYLGYVGKKLLAKWLALPDAERSTVVAAWVAERRAEHGSG